MWNRKDLLTAQRDGKLLLMYLFHFHELRNTVFNFESAATITVTPEPMYRMTLALSMAHPQVPRYNKELGKKEMVPGYDDLPKASTIVELCPDLIVENKRIDSYKRVIYDVVEIKHDLNFIRSDFFK